MRIFAALLFTMILTGAVKAQEPADNIFPLKDGKIIYEKIVLLDSASKGEIFKRTKIWAVDAIRSQKNALQTEDKEEGFIIYQTNFDAPFTYPATAMMPTEQISKWRFYCTIRFLIKDNKCKITIDDINSDGELVYSASQKNSVTNFRALTEPALKKGLMSKSNREKFFNNAKVSFQAANLTVIAIMDSYENMIRSKENSDF